MRKETLLQLREDQKAEQAELNKLFPDNAAPFGQYYKILQITNAASSTEHSDFPKSEQLTTARRHAYKLVMAFGDFQKANTYLEKYKENHPRGDNPVHDACLFSLPDHPWNIALWQEIVAKNTPSSPDSLIMRILPFAHKIEAHDKGGGLRLSIQNELKEMDKRAFGKDYDLIKNSDKKDWVASEIKTKQKSIVKTANKVFDILAREALDLPIRGKLDAVQAALVRQWKAGIPQILEDLKSAQRGQWCKKVEALYDSKRKEVNSLSREAYINKKLKATERLRSKILKSKYKPLNAKISLTTLSDIATTFCYQHAEKNPAAAKLFFKYNLSEFAFNEYLALTPQDDDKKIPPIRIDGEAIHPDYKGFYLKKLDPADPRAYVLGKFTSCCQYPGGDGESCNKNGITDPNAGFYILCKQSPSGKERIVSQAWVWRRGGGIMVFDSIETHLDYRKHKKIISDSALEQAEKHEKMISDFFVELADQLVKQYDVPQVRVGKGHTPENLHVLKRLSTVRLIDYYEHSDSREQYTIADKSVPFIKSIILGSDQKTTQDMPPLTRSGIKEWCQILADSNKDMSFFSIDPYIFSLTLDENFVKNTMKHAVDAAELMKRDIEAAELIRDFQRFISYCVDPLSGDNLDTQYLQNLCEKGVPVDVRIPEYCCAALCLLSAIKEFEAVSLLLKHGADVNLRDTSKQRTPLHWSLRERGNSLRVAKLLIDNSARLNDEDCNGDTPLHIACESSQGIETIRLLVNSGSIINCSNVTTGDTPLHLAMERGNIEVCRFLILQGADLNMVNKKGQTPLLRVISHGDMELYKPFIKLLLEHGVNVQNESWETHQTQHNRKMITLIHVFSIIEKALLESKRSPDLFQPIDLKSRLRSALRAANTYATGRRDQSAVYQAIDILLSRKGEHAISSKARELLKEKIQVRDYFPIWDYRLDLVPRWFT